MNKTANFQLTQWEKTDRIMMEDFNRDNAAIDAALKGNADKAAALQTALAGVGNCSMEIKSYTGNGKFGQNNPNSITFAKKPKAVLIFGQYFFLLLTEKSTSPAPILVYYNMNDRTIWQTANYNWNGNTLQWYSITNAQLQGNLTNYVYQVVAFY